jgi:hypothetical protein
MAAMSLELVAAAVAPEAGLSTAGNQRHISKRRLLLQLWSDKRFAGVLLVHLQPPGSQGERCGDNLSLRFE